MIAHVSGKLIHKSTDSVVVDVHGVGYEVFIPLSTFYKLPDVNSTISLRVHTHLRDDSIQLYGFLTQQEKEAFQLLIGVSGIGPRLARNILSGIAVDDLVSSIASSDRARLNSIPGVGAKSAERLILELKDKIKSVAVSEPQGLRAAEVDALSTDVISALENLGYKNNLATEAVKKAKARVNLDSGFEELFKESLKALSKK